MEAEAHPHKWLALIGLSLLAFTAFLDFTIVSTAMPFIQASFHASVLKLQWVATAFSMMISISMIAVGKLGDIFDRRLVFYLGFILFAATAILAALSPNMTWLIIARTIQGFSAAIIFTQSAALLPCAFPADQQHQAIGIYSIFTGLGLAIGPFLGGLMVHFFNWRYIFWLNIPIIVVGLLCCIFTLSKPAQNTQPNRFDWVGLILLIIITAGIIFGTISSAQWGWNHLYGWLPVVAGLVAIPTLFLYEQRHPDPLLSLDAFRNPYAQLAMLACFCAAIVTSVYLFFDPLYFKIILHYSATQIGLILVAMPVMQVLISSLFPWLIKRIGLTHLLLTGIVLALIAAIGNSFFNHASPITFIVIILLCMGFVWGAANTGSITVVSEHLPAKDSGTILGTIFTVWNLAGAILLAVTSVLFHTFQNDKIVALLHQPHHAISRSIQHQLQQAIADPDHATRILHATSSGSTKIYNVFSHIFVASLQQVSWLMVGLTLIILLTMLRIVKRRINPYKPNG